MKTGFVQDPRFQEHDTGEGHPECSARLSVALKYLEAQSWYETLTQVEANSAELEQILKVHDTDYGSLPK